MRIPCSMLRATVMLLSHIGRQEKADLLERALDICMLEEKKLTITGRDTGLHMQRIWRLCDGDVQNLSK